ncbi:MAG: hypothetical protein WBI27_18770, partial [Thermoanaerobaculia bacterium]
MTEGTLRDPGLWALFALILCAIGAGAREPWHEAPADADQSEAVEGTNWVSPGVSAAALVTYRGFDPIAVSVAHPEIVLLSVQTDGSPSDV